MRAIAHRFEVLGFRIIDGGGNDELVLKTPGLAWAVARQHKHLLDNIRAYREEIGRDLGQSFDRHCRLAKYNDRYGRPQDCFELTQTGVLIVAAKYDAALQLLAALLFDAVNSRNEAEADSVVRQITARLTEIRGKARQGELFDLPASVPKVRANHPDHWVDAEEPYENRYKPRPRGEETWDEIHDGIRYFVVAQREKLHYARVTLAHIHTNYRPRAWLVPTIPQATLTWDMGKTPRPVLASVLKRLGLYSDLVRDTLDGMFFDDIREKPQGSKKA